MSVGVSKGLQRFLRFLKVRIVRKVSQSSQSFSKVLIGFQSPSKVL